MGGLLGEPELERKRPGLGLLRPGCSLLKPGRQAGAQRAHRGRQVVDGGEGGEIPQQRAQQAGVHGRGVLRDDGLLRQHHAARGLGVRRQQAPVHVCAVAQVRVVRLLRGTAGMSGRSCSVSGLAVHHHDGFGQRMHDTHGCHEQQRCRRYMLLHHTHWGCWNRTTGERGSTPFQGSFTQGESCM